MVVPEAPSTHVETALPTRREKSNVHHVVPRSRGGSNKDRNKTDVAISRHADYHELFAENKLPTEVYRLAAINTIGLNNYTIEPRQLKAILTMLPIADWQSNYDPTALVQLGTLSSMSRQPEKMYEHATRHQVEELLSMKQTHNALIHGRGFPHQKNRFIRRFDHFFETDNPLVGMEKFLTEESGGQRTWVASLRDKTRNELLSNIVDSEPVLMTRGINYDLRVLLSGQIDVANNHYQKWIKIHRKCQLKHRKREHRDRLRRQR